MPIPSPTYTNTLPSIADRKTALLFAGGGMKGAIEVGMSRYLVRSLRWKIMWVRGVSTGALQAVMLAQGLQYGMGQLENLWLNLTKTSDLFIMPHWWQKLPRLFGGSSLASNKPLFELLKFHLDMRRVAGSGIDLKVGTTNFNTKEFVEVGPKGLPEEVFMQFVLASTSIPGEFPGVWIESDQYPEGWYFDGGVTSMAPSLYGLIHEGAERIVVCLCNPAKPIVDSNSYKRTLPALKEALSISLNDNAAGDLARMKDEVERINECIRNGVRGYEGKRLVDFIVIGPSGPPPIGTFDVDPKKIRIAMDYGEQLANETIEAYYER